jgi:hypothetical protein
VSTGNQLKDIALDITWAKIAQKYFDKSSSWIYNKINEIDGNGGKGGFTKDELQQLKMHCMILQNVSVRQPTGLNNEISLINMSCCKREIVANLSCSHKKRLTTLCKSFLPALSG